MVPILNDIGMMEYAQAFSKNKVDIKNEDKVISIIMAVGRFYL